MIKSMFEGTPIRKAFATDPNKENSGVWRDHESGISVQIRRSSRPEHKRALRKFYRPFQSVTNVDPRDEMKVKMRAGAQELVADWGVRVTDKDDEGNIISSRLEPLVNSAGETIRPTEENVLKAFEEHPDFFEWVTDEADTFEHYRIAAVEESAGNSLASSSGNGSGEAPKPQPSSSDELQGESESQPSSSVQS